MPNQLADQKAGSHRVVEFDTSSRVDKVLTGHQLDGRGGNS